MEMNRKAVYEAPEVNIVTLGQECVICIGSPDGNGREDYGFGGLDEPASVPMFPDSGFLL
jgi:hypothetical protein